MFKRKISIGKEELERLRPVYMKDLQDIRDIQNRMKIKVVRLDIPDQDNKDGREKEDAEIMCYGHFMWDDIFVKIKSKGLTGPS